MYKSLVTSGKSENTTDEMKGGKGSENSSLVGAGATRCHRRDGVIDSTGDDAPTPPHFNSTFSLCVCVCVCHPLKHAEGERRGIYSLYPPSGWVGGWVAGCWGGFSCPLQLFDWMVVLPLHVYLSFFFSSSFIHLIRAFLLRFGVDSTRPSDYP